MSRFRSQECFAPRPLSAKPARFRWSRYVTRAGVSWRLFAQLPSDPRQTVSTLAVVAFERMKGESVQWLAGIVRGARRQLAAEIRRIEAERTQNQALAEMAEGLVGDFDANA